MDKVGNAALGFSVSSQGVFPSACVAGRAATDPAGQMFGPLVLVNGSGVRRSSRSIAGETIARCRLIPWMTAPSGTPMSITQRPAASTGRRGLAHSNSIAAEEEASKGSTPLNGHALSRTDERGYHSSVDSSERMTFTGAGSLRRSALRRRALYLRTGNANFVAPVRWDSAGRRVCPL